MEDPRFYNPWFLINPDVLEKIVKNNLKEGGINPSLILRTLYENEYSFRRDESPKGKTRPSLDESCFRGALYRDEETIDDMLNYKELVEEFVSLDIYKLFGISFFEYINQTPYSMGFMVDLARKYKEELQRETKKFGDMKDAILNET